MDKKKIISLLATGVIMVGITLSLGTGAWFTDSKTSTANAFKSGTLKLGEPGTITSGMSLGNIFPGWTESKTVTISNQGSLDLKYKMKISPIDNILYNGQTPLQVNVNNQGFVDINKLGEVFLGQIAARSNGTFNIAFKLPGAAGNDYANKTAAFDFNFTAAQLNDTSFTVNNVQQLVIIKNINDLNTAINSQADGQTWLIEPGTYTLTETNLNYTAPELGGFFGVITANNITVKGVGNPIINSNGNPSYTGTFMIKGNNVTVDGINFQPNIQGANRTVDVAGANATIKNCQFTIDGALYIPAEFISGSLGTLSITGNSFTNTMVCLDSAKNADSIIISNNTFNMGDSNVYAIGNVSWTTPATTTMAAVTVSNNTFNTNSIGSPIIRNRMTGTFNLTGNTIDGSTPSDWTSYLLLQNDKFTTPTNPIVVVDGKTYSMP